MADTGVEKGGEGESGELLSSLRSWCQRELSKVLESSVESDLLDYLLNIELERDLIEYLQDVMGSDTVHTKAFVEEFLRRWRKLHAKVESSPSSRTTGDKNVVDFLEELVRPDRKHMILYSQDTSPKTPPGFKQKSDLSNNVVAEGRSVPSNRRPNPKQKLNFVPLMSKEGQSRVAMYLPGRHPCQCLAVKHSLVNNCVRCGRIVCSQEGSGPCLFCGAVVCTPEEEEWINKDSKKARRFREQFFKKHNIKDTGRPLDHLQRSDGESQALDKALHHRNKLLEFDQTSASRTKVIDDESDYFSVDTNRWLSTDERKSLRTKEETLREQKYGSRRNKTVMLDIAGRKVVEEESNVDLYSEQHAKEAMSEGRRVVMDENDAPVLTHAGALYNPDIPIARPQFIETDEKEMRKKPGPKLSHGRGDGSGFRNKGRSGGPDRLQDRGLQEMKDGGACLSMHQPWASLLVHGIKKCEGRTWYSTHRGRLWIAAASKEPSDKDILDTQQFYMDRCKGKEYMDFPLEYPVSCLLGCVDVLDCLPQEDYSEKFPDGESESDYVFVVDNPQQLTVKFPVKGHHKIWKLDRQMHLSAKQGLKTNFITDVY